MPVTVVESQFQNATAGARIPPFMYGTAWKEERTRACVEQALSAGFRAIDTANQRKHYFEAQVGEALKNAFSSGTLARADVFLQTKFTSLGGQDHRLPYDPDADVQTQVLQSFEVSLEHLQTDFIDSYVLHGPSVSRGLHEDDWQAWRAMEMLCDQGKVKHLGISNVTAEQLRTLCDRARVLPKFVQNRCYARRRWDREVRDYCQQHDMIYQGFSLLTANVEIFRHPRFLEIMARSRCTLAQGVFRFALQVGMLPLTGTTNIDHMREDLKMFEFEFSSEDIETIEDLLI